MPEQSYYPHSKIISVEMDIYKLLRFIRDKYRFIKVYPRRWNNQCLFYDLMCDCLKNNVWLQLFYIFPWDNDILNDWCIQTTTWLDVMATLIRMGVFCSKKRSSVIKSSKECC